MATVPAPSSNSSTLPSFPPPCPKSPPEYPDLYGKRREAAKIQMLEREIVEYRVSTFRGFVVAAVIPGVLFNWNYLVAVIATVTVIYVAVVRVLPVRSGNLVRVLFQIASNPIAVKMFLAGQAVATANSHLVRIVLVVANGNAVVSQNVRR
ncbi:hypothetical protein ACFE04_013457 [Oxalis oulophora]